MIIPSPQMHAIPLILINCYLGLEPHIVNSLDYKFLDEVILKKYLKVFLRQLKDYLFDTLTTVFYAPVWKF